MRCRVFSRFIGSFFIFAFLFWAFHSPLLAQSAAAVVLHQVNVDSFPTTNVLVSAWNGSQPITDLGVDDLTLVEDGQIVPIEEVTSLDRSEVPVSLILVLDTSTSMQANNAINDAKAAALSILDRLKPNDRVALLAFGGEIDRNPDVLDPTRELAFTTDKEQLRAVIAGLQANGPTPLYDATVKAIRLSANEAAGSRAMILLSDGRDEVILDGQSQPASLLTADDAINEARTGSMPIFTIGLGNSIDRQFLERLADQSGGTFANTPTSDQLNALFNQALDRLLQRSVIRYQSKASPDGLPHALQVQLNRDEQQASGQSTFLAPLPDQPVVRLDFEDNQQVQGDVTIQPTIFARDGIINVQLLVDEEVVEESNSSPYALTWRSGEARWLEPPNHTVSVQVTDDGGDVGEQSVLLVVLPPTAASPESEPTATVIATGSSEETNGSQEAGGNEAGGTNEEAGGSQAGGTNEETSPTGTEGAGDTSPPEDSRFQFIFSNWFPFALLGVAGLLFIGVLFIWRRDRNRSTNNIFNSPPPPQPTPEPLPAVSVAAEPSQPFSQSAFFSTDIHDHGTALESQTAFQTNVATELQANPTIVDAPLEKTVILGQKQRLASLMVVDGADKGKTFNLSEEKVIIGRGKEAQIALNDRTVSRKQAIIKIEEDEYFLYNRSNSNVTYLNGQQVKGRVLLRDRDQIEMGNTTLQFIDS